MDILQNISKKDIIQNMKDAGCSDNTIDNCIDCIEKGRREELLKRLAAHRSSVLDSIHREERQIECLDYLVYQIGKNKEVVL